MLTTDEPDPKDAGVLVTVADGLHLTALASASRRLKGRAQTRNRGADIFLANPVCQDMGRICHWRECALGPRVSCRAQHCGWRTYLHDDLDVLTLDAQLMHVPPIQVWFRLAYDKDVPVDLIPYLLEVPSGPPGT